MKNPNYSYFECLCALLAEPNDKFDHQFKLENKLRDVDWEQLLKIADGYLVAPALYLSLKRQKYLDFLDMEARNFLRIVYELNYQRNRNLKNGALSVIRLLNTQNVQPILLKGIAGLLTGLYDDDGERFIGDIDLMVDQTELIVTVKVLVDNGYHCDAKILEKVFHSTFYQRELTIMSEHDSIKIDLHVRPIERNDSQAFLLADEARVDAKLFVVDDVAALLPSPFFRLMHNFYHAQHVDPYYFTGMINLRQLMDWGRLWKRYETEVEYAKIEHKLCLYRKNKSFGLYVLNAERLLSISRPTGHISRWGEHVLFYRQKFRMQYYWFHNLNSAQMYIIHGLLQMTPEKMRQTFGDLPMHKLIILRLIRFLDPRWYQRRVRELKTLWR